MVMRILGAVGVLLVAGGGLLLYAGFGAFLPWRQQAEAARLAELARVSEGSVVAEIGAGGGRFTEILARRAGDRGRVYSTEISEENRDAIRKRIEGAGLRNVSVIEAASDSTNLPDGCCDVVLLRNVYHHIASPEVFAASLARALKPGGRLVIIDFEPGALWLHGGRPDGASERRTGHGVDRAQVKEEMAGAGLVLDREIRDWSGPLWMMLFRAAAPGS